MSAPTEQKRVYVVSLGCPKNQVDTEIMLGRVAADGYTLTDDPAAADLLLVNTCSFIADATKESVDTVLELAEVKKANPNAKLIVAGCLVQRYASELREELPEVDAFVGTGHVQDVVRAVDAAAKGPVEPERFVSVPEWVHGADEPRINTLTGASAYLKILEGCPQACSFCIIPKLRGGLVSRRPSDLVSEAEGLAAQGIRELNLVGQDCTSYGYDLGRDVRLAGLLHSLSEVEGLHWIRTMYLYPARVSEALMKAMCELPRVLPYADMPLQHAADSVLKAMNRGTTLDKQRRLLDSMRAQVPGLVLRSGFIVGFPGETDEDFRTLREFISEQRFDRVGVFTYSPEAGTPAAELADPVPVELAAERRDELMELQQGISLERNEELVGQEIEVLVEGEHAETELLLVGRTAGQAPDIDGQVLLNDVEEGAADPVVGSFRKVLITEAHPYDLVGTILAESVG